MSLIKSKETIEKFETGYRQIEKEISDMISEYQAEIEKLNSKKSVAEKKIEQLKKAMEKPDISLDEYMDCEIKLNASMKYLDRVNSEIRDFEDPKKHNRADTFRKLRDRAVNLIREENTEELESLSKYIVSSFSDTAKRQERILDGLKDLCAFLSISTVPVSDFYSRACKGETVGTEIEQAEKMIDFINESRKTK